MLSYYQASKQEGENSGLYWTIYCLKFYINQTQVCDKEEEEEEAFRRRHLRKIIIIILNSGMW